MSGSQEATTRITMKKFVCMSLFVAAIMALYSFAPKDKIDETIQEEVGLSLSKISDDKLCKGHVYPLSKPYTWAGFLGGVSAKQKFYWSTFRLLALSPDGNDLAYISVKDKAGNVMIRRAAGMSTATQRTFRSVMGVTWGCDDKLYFSDISSGSYNSKIFATNARAGSVMQQMTNSGNDDDPVLSPDGKTLFFSRLEVGGPSIWSLNLETGALTSCARGFGACPIDNERFLCVRNSQTGQSEIWLVDFNKGQETLVLSDPERGFTNPSLSPDGQWIVCEGSSKSSISKKFNLDIFAVRIDGTRFTQLTYHPAMDCCPVFSKDGKNIYFLSNRSQRKSDYCDIWSMKFLL